MRIGLAIWPKSAAGWIRLALSTVPGAQLELIGSEAAPGPHRFDLLIIDGDSPGPHYLTYARGYQVRHGDCPALILGTSSSPAMMFVEWAPDMTHFIAKPFRVEEVKAAVERLLLAAQAPVATPASGPGLTGTAVQLGYLSTLNLADLLQMLCLNGWTGRIEVENVRTAAKGFVYLSAGALVHAEAGMGLTGEPACFELLGWPRSVFQFLENCAPMAPSITGSWQNVLMEAARLKDEGQHPPFAASA